MCKSFIRRVLHYSRQRKNFLFMEQQGIPQYERYFFSGMENLLYISVAICVVLFFAFFFYRSMWAVGFLWPIGLLLYLTLQKEKGEKRRARLEQEFQDCMYSLSANLRAGYSVENAFVESMPDMEALFGKQSLIVKELQQIKRGLSNNVTLEELLKDFGLRSASNRIREFSEVFSIARASGGNLPGVLSSTADLIGEKIILQQQIQVLISGKRLEQNIMNVIPFFIVCYIEAANSGFFDVLYQDFFGRFVMTGCLVVYLIAFFLAKRICRMGM